MSSATSETVHMYFEKRLAGRYGWFVFVTAQAKHEHIFVIFSDSNCANVKVGGIKCTEPPYKTIPIVTGTVKLPSKPSGVSLLRRHIKR